MQKGDYMTYHVKVKPENLENFVESLSKDVNEGKLLSHKMTIKTEKTWGDKLQPIEWILSKMGINLMARTSEKRVAFSIVKFVEDYPNLKTEQISKLAGIIDTLSTRYNKTRKVQNQEYFHNLKNLILTPKKDPEPAPTKQPVVDEAPKTNPAEGKKLNHQEILLKAEEQFKDHPFKTEIINEITASLNYHELSGSIQIDGRARIFREETEEQKHKAISNAVQEFFTRKDLFEGIQIGILESACIRD